jgi:hypothetical protein
MRSSFQNVCDLSCCRAAGSIFRAAGGGQNKVWEISRVKRAGGKAEKFTRPENTTPTKQPLATRHHGVLRRLKCSHDPDILHSDTVG